MCLKWSMYSEDPSQPKMWGRIISISCFSKGWSCRRFFDFVIYMYWFPPLPYLMHWIRLLIYPYPSNIHHLPSIQLNHAPKLNLFPHKRYGSTVKTDLSCLKKSSEIFKELETSAQMLFPWTPVMFLPRSEWKKQCWVSDLNQRLKKSASFSDWQAGSLGGWLSWAGLLRAGGWRPWLLHPWCDGETWPSSKKETEASPQSQGTSGKHFDAWWAE